MFSAAVLVVMVLNLAVGAFAHGGRWDWVHGLPSCWRDCLKDNGCNSKSCICDSSQDGDYLTSAVECIVRSCREDALSVSLGLLAPLQMYCKATRDEIPGSVMSSAYACATVTPSPTSKTHRSTQIHQTTKADSGLESTITSTVTLTTTNGDGNTLQVLIPIVMGPNTMTTGEMVTSTLDSKPSATSAVATSDAAPAAEPTSAAPSQTQDWSSSSPEAKETNIGNGSPFDLSAQGGAARWTFSAAGAGVGVLLWTLVRI